MISTHRARNFLSIAAQSNLNPFRGPMAARLGVDLDSNNYQGECLMENNTQDELKAHLMAVSEEFRTLASQHALYHQKLEELEAKPHLTDREQMEEVLLKKQKLRLKDQMNAILAQHRAQHVA